MQLRWIPSVEILMEIILATSSHYTGELLVAIG